MFIKSLKYSFVLFLTFYCLNTVLYSQKNSTFLFIPDHANFITYGNASHNFNISNDRLIQWNIYKDIAKLSSGKRIITAGDDPSGLAVSEKMQSVINGLKQESINAEDYRNYLNYVESAIAHDQDLIKRIRQLAVQASNGILGEDDREMLQSEADQMIDEINTNADFAQFNRKRIMPDLTASSLGLDAVDIAKRPDAAIGIADDAIKLLLRRRTIAGSKSNVLSYEIEGKSYYIVNITGAMSNITDADMAEEVTKLATDGVALKVKYGIMVRGK